MLLHRTPALGHPQQWIAVTTLSNELAILAIGYQPIGQRVRRQKYRMAWGFAIEREAGTIVADFAQAGRSEEHTSELQSLMRSSYAVFCLKKKTPLKTTTSAQQQINKLLTRRHLYTTSRDKQKKHIHSHTNL